MGPVGKNVGCIHFIHGWLTLVNLYPKSLTPTLCRSALKLICWCGLGCISIICWFMEFFIRSWIHPKFRQYLSYLKPSYLGHILMYLEHPHFQSRKGFSNKKKLGPGQCLGAHFWRCCLLRGQNECTNHKFFKIFNWIFFVSIFEKLNTFHPQLNIHFASFRDLLSCGSLGPPLPGSQRVNHWGVTNYNFT